MRFLGQSMPLLLLYHLFLSQDSNMENYNDPSIDFYAKLYQLKKPLFPFQCSFLAIWKITGFHITLRQYIKGHHAKFSCSRVTFYHLPLYTSHEEDLFPFPSQHIMVYVCVWVASSNKSLLPSKS